jgi:hypothetical protein
MAYIRRLKVALLIVIITNFLSACGSEPVILMSTSPILVDQFSPTVSIKPHASNLGNEDFFSINDFITNGAAEQIQKQTDLVLIKSVASRFRKPEALIQEIVNTAQKYSYEDFPKRNDILAVIAVESTFNTKAHHHGSWGLMQIEAKSHRGKFDNIRQLTDIETNIKIGSDLLREYYSLLRFNRNSALTAYNVGIGSFEDGKRNPPYLYKVNREYTYLQHS